MNYENKQDRNGGLEQWITFHETMAQPAIWRSWGEPLNAISEPVSAWLKSRDHDEVWFCGAGSSAFIGDALAASLNRPGARTRYRSIPTTDLVSCPASYLPATGRILAVSFGRSGDSSETIGTLDLLDAHLPQADRLHFTCNPQGILANRKPKGPGEQKVVLLPEATNDRGFAMTSSYSTMLLSALACLDDARPLPIAQALNDLADAGERILRDAITHAAGSRRPSRAVFLGSGALAAAARESALKVLELAQGQIPTLWDTTLGFRHGPKAIADAGTRIHVFISGTAHTSRYDLDAVGELRAQFGDECVVVLGSKGTDADIAIPVIGNDAWTLVLHVLVAQIQAIVWSDSLKVNVDNPFVDGNLSRVVSGVALYPYAGVR